MMVSSFIGEHTQLLSETSLVVHLGTREGGIVSIDSI